MKKILTLLIVSGLLLITACQTTTVPDENQDPVLQSERVEPVQIIPQTPLPDSNSGNEGITMTNLLTTPDANAQRMAQIAKENLAQELKISIDQIQITAIEAMIWSDSSLGCPQMGVMYTQVLTSGFKISLETNGKTYVYHTDDQERVLLCRSRPSREVFLTP